MCMFNYPNHLSPSEFGKSTLFCIYSVTHFKWDHPYKKFVYGPIFMNFFLNDKASKTVLWYHILKLRLHSQSLLWFFFDVKIVKICLAIFLSKIWLHHWIQDALKWVCTKLYEKIFIIKRLIINSIFVLCCVKNKH